MVLARRVGLVLATIVSMTGVLAAGLAAAPNAPGNRIGTVDRLLRAEGERATERALGDGELGSSATRTDGEPDGSRSLIEAPDEPTPAAPAPRKARPSTLTVTTDENEATTTTVVPTTSAPGERETTVGPNPADPATDQTPIACNDGTENPARLDENEATVLGLYCALLGRAPDAEGLDYWSNLLADGLAPGELAAELEASAEFRQRNESATATTAPTPPSSAPSSSTAAPARATTTITAAPTPRNGGSDALRPRTSIAQDRFAAWVEARGFTDRTWITDALVHGWWVGDGRRINVALVHLSGSDGIRVSPGGRSRSTVGTWADEIGAHVAVNGNWYAPWDGPAVSAGAVYGGDDHLYTSLFGFTAGLDTIVEHHRAVKSGVDGRITEGVSGHPTLVHRGVETTDFGGDPTFTNRHPRTAIGVDQSGDVLILVTVDGRSTSARGMTGAETASLMKAIGAHDAVMLDGGGSTTMWIRGKGVVNRPSGGLRAVGNQIAVFG